MLSSNRFFMRAPLGADLAFTFRDLPIIIGLSKELALHV